MPPTLNDIEQANRIRVVAMVRGSNDLAIGPNGHFYVSDETGPSIYEFEPVTSLTRRKPLATKSAPAISRETIQRS